MFANVKKVELSDGSKIVCKDLTYGFVLGLESGEVEETTHSVVEDGTDLTKEDIFKLRRSDVTILYNTILQLTYPHLYNEDGTLKTLDDFQETDDNNKKKA